MITIILILWLSFIVFFIITIAYIVQTKPFTETFENSCAGGHYGDISSNNLNNLLDELNSWYTKQHKQIYVSQLKPSYGYCKIVDDVNKCLDNKCSCNEIVHDLIMYDNHTPEYDNEDISEKLNVNSSTKTEHFENKHLSELKQIISKYN